MKTRTYFPAQHASTAPVVCAKPESDALTFWSFAVGLILAFTAVRLVYLIWLSPWELVGDEAYYWVQSQHPALSYAEKGPLLPWLIRGSCAAFGNTEWAVRLPVLLGAGIAAWGVGRLTLALTRGNQLTALLSVFIFILTPAFLANAQICTQDGLLIPLLVALSAVGLRLVRRWESEYSTWGEWLLFYGLLGLGVLLKQSVLLFMSAFVVYAFIRRRQLRWSMTILAQQIAGALVVLAIVSPVLIWERRNGWPMLRHTLGHLGAGGDQAGKIQHGNQALWVANTLGGFLGAVGPSVGLMVWASVRAWRRRREDDDAAWRDRLWLMCAGWPSVLFFVALGLVKPVVPSWPLPCVVPLVPLAGELAAEQFAHYRGVFSPSATGIGGMPSGFSRLWDAVVIYGLGALVILSFPTLLGRLPIVGNKIQHSVLARLSGGQVFASRIRAAADGRGVGAVSRVVATHYQPASLLSFYLPPNFQVTCAGSYLANRLSNYDTWDDTRLDSPARLGESMLLVGATQERWERALSFDRVEPLGDDLFLGVDFHGPRVARIDRRPPLVGGN